MDGGGGSNKNLASNQKVHKINALSLFWNASNYTKIVILVLHPTLGNTPSEGSAMT